MALTNATPMQRLTLIFLRLMLAASCALAITSQFEWVNTYAHTPFGSLFTTIVPFGLDVGYESEDFGYRELGYGHSGQYTDSELKEVFDESRPYSEDRLKHCVPGVHISFLYDEHGYCVGLRVNHLWIIAITFALNVAANRRIRRRILRAKSLKPEADS